MADDIGPAEKPDWRKVADERQQASAGRSERMGFETAARKFLEMTRGGNNPGLARGYKILCSLLGSTDPAFRMTKADPEVCVTAIHADDRDDFKALTDLLGIKGEWFEDEPPHEVLRMTGWDLSFDREGAATKIEEGAGADVVFHERIDVSHLREFDAAVGRMRRSGQSANRS